MNEYKEFSLNKQNEQSLLLEIRKNKKIDSIFFHGHEEINPAGSQRKYIYTTFDIKDNTSRDREHKWIDGDVIFHTNEQPQVLFLLFNSREWTERFSIKNFRCSDDNFNYIHAIHFSFDDDDTFLINNPKGVDLPQGTKMVIVEFNFPVDAPTRCNLIAEIHDRHPPLRSKSVLDCDPQSGNDPPAR